MTVLKMTTAKDFSLGEVKPYRLFPSRRLSIVALLFCCSFLMMFNFFIMSFSVNCMTNTAYGQGQNTSIDDDDDPARTFGHKVCGVVVDTNGTADGVRLNWNKQQVSNIMSGSAWGSFFFIFVTGFLIDRYGVKWFIVAAMINYTITSALIPIAATHHWIAVFALRFIQGIGVLIGWPSIFVVSTQWFPKKERGLLLSLTGSGFLLGCLLAMVLSGQFCESEIGWQGTFYLAAILNIICAILWLLFYDNKMEDTKYMAPAEVDYLKRDRGDTQASKVKPHTPWRRIFTSKSVWGIMLCFFGDYYMFFYVGDFMPAFYKDVMGFPDGMSGILCALPSLLQFVGRLIAGPISDQVEKIMSRTNSTKVNTAVAGILPGIFIMLVAAFNCDTKVGAVICFSIAYFFYSFLIGGALKSLSYIAPTFAGTLAGLSQTIMYIAAIVVPYITAAIIPDQGSAKEYHIAGFVAGAIGIIGTLMYIALGSCDLQEWAKPENLSYPESADVEQQKPKPIVIKIPADRKFSIDTCVAW